MKLVVVMFDTLNRQFLPPYGARDVHAPQFDRLAAHSVTFDRSYGGSMPCMPTRREMHTGRLNFLHRGWGPLEPFDDSVPELLGEHGVTTHLVTDHQHYWLDGGATYHPRFRTFEFFRGQEGDEWKGQVADPDLSGIRPFASNHALRRQDQVNRQHLRDEADHPQRRTFDAGLEFIETNANDDDWFLQIETFDPHEPFFSGERFHRLYDSAYEGPEYDWPDYAPRSETDAELAHLRARYSALLSMCDESLGRVLDAFDRHELWDDTMLVVCTDHGLLLGEHDWLGKNVPPYYEETIHTPLFIWDPRSRVRGERRDALVQMIDLGPTMLEFFGVDRRADMQGAPLVDAIANDAEHREGALFGIFGGHVNVTDGRHVYLRAPVHAGNSPLAEYTLMPTSMRGRLPAEVLREAELVDPLPFTKGMPVLRVPGYAYADPHAFGTMLFDLSTDPGQEHPLRDAEIELRMARLMTRLMRESDAPAEQFERLGLPVEGEVGTEHLLVEAHWPQLVSARSGPIDGDDFTGSRFSVNTPISELLAHDPARQVVRAVLGPIVDGPLPPEALELSLVQVANLAFGLVSRPALDEIAQGLAALDVAEPTAG
ncbi:sulfatase [Agromyces sp. NPDC056965]|uniref:sulfatase n=1 Tax=Agromyces sp. NPDC056965 TaxID=3345983 RepID=UPI0036304869